MAGWMDENWVDTRAGWMVEKMEMRMVENSVATTELKMADKRVV